MGKQKILTISLWGCILILLSYLFFGCAATTPQAQKGEQVDTGCRVIKFVKYGEIKLPPHFPDITKFTIKLEMQQLGISLYSFTPPNEDDINYSITLSDSKKEILLAEEIYKKTEKAFHWRCFDGIPEKKDVSIYLAMQHLEGFISKKMEENHE